MMLPAELDDSMFGPTVQQSLQIYQNSMIPILTC